MLIGLLLSTSACFEVVAPESLYNTPAPVTRTVTVTPTPPAAAPAPVAAPKPAASTPTPIAPSSRGIVGTWNFDNNAFDGTRGGNDGSIIGGGTFTDGMPGFGKALKSGGRSYGFFRQTPSPSLDITTNLTLEAWIRLDSLPGNSPLVSKTSPPENPLANSYQLQIGGDGHPGMSVWKDQETTTFLRGDTLLKIGQWYHLAGTYEYAGDGKSIMKIFVNGKLDGMLTDAVGPVFVGTGQLGIGKLDGAIDEVHIWDTSYPDYALAVAPMAGINQPGTSSNLTAYVSPAVPGVKVNFEVLPGSPNSGKNAGISTDSYGVARWTYTDSGTKEGMDNVRVWIHREWSGSFDASKDVSAEVRQFWLKEFVTASGNIIEGDRVRWTFTGNVGVIGSTAGVFDSNIVGEFELVDHVRKVTYRAETFRPNNNFFRENIQSSQTGARAVNFGGFFTNDRDDRRLMVVIWMIDAAGADMISVRADPSGVPGNIWIGTLIPDWTAGLTQTQYILQVPISSGNIQINR